MPKNVVIFSDGTGQRGGLLVDERRSNIYKLYRATRCGPDSSVNPAEQVAFYDPGIGTLPAGIGLLSNLSRRVYNIVSQALGIGLTGNIVDCYAALLKLWRPGDHILLFGFSRGAYTTRCLAAVIAKCGVPTRARNGAGIRYDDKTIKRIAEEAVRNVYQHTSSWERSKATPRQLELLDQREALAAQFRERYGSGDHDGPNAHPYFIGVFDTVASLSNPVALTALIAATPLLTAILTTGAYFSCWLVDIRISWWLWFLIITVGAIGLSWYLNVLSRIRAAFGLPGYKWYKTLHLAEPRMNFYDKTLNPNVAFARHALAIDECRASFQRVGWGQPGVWKSSTPVWFEQLWFAGDHSDIGGSYEENESRLSDISLRWMLDAATETGLKYDPSALHLYPDAAGPHHDEARSSLFRFASKELRRVPHDAPLHPSVLERFEAPAVLVYDHLQPYRPENLRNHDHVRRYYEQPHA